MFECDFVDQKLFAFHQFVTHIQKSVSLFFSPISKRCLWYIVSNFHQDQSALYKSHQNIGDKICGRLLRVVGDTCCSQCHILLYQRWWHRRKVPVHTVQAHVSWHLYWIGCFSYFKQHIFDFSFDHFEAYGGTMKHLSAGFMVYVLVFGCRAHTSSWIVSFYRSFWRPASISMHFISNLKQSCRQSTRPIHNNHISNEMLNRCLNEPFAFIIWWKSKWQMSNAQCNCH